MFDAFADSICCSAGWRIAASGLCVAVRIDETSMAPGAVPVATPAKERVRGGGQAIIWMRCGRALAHRARCSA